MPYKNRKYHNEYTLARENYLYQNCYEFRLRKAERSKEYQRRRRNSARGLYTNTKLSDYTNREFSFVINFN